MALSKKIAQILLTALLVFLTAIFLSDPLRYAKSVLEGISLWAANVLPTLFPFLVFTALLTGLPPFARLTAKLSPLMGRLFRVSGEGGGIALLAAVSGYPVGARLVFDNRERLGKGERFRVACLATSSGPPFLVGTVGGMMFGSAKMGWIMLFSHFAAIWGVCVALRFFAKPVKPSPPRPRAGDPALLYDSLYNAVISVLCVGGFVALFNCFGDMLKDIVPFSSPFAEALFRGLLEMTTGCAAFARLGTPLSAACAAACVTFGGVCVLCQQAAFLTRADVPMLPFVAVKAAQGALAFLICLAFAPLL